MSFIGNIECIFRWSCSYASVLMMVVDDSLTLVIDVGLIDATEAALSALTLKAEEEKKKCVLRNLSYSDLEVSCSRVSLFCSRWSR